MARVVDPTRWESERHFPPWLGVVLVLVIVWLASVASGLYRAFSVP